MKRTAGLLAPLLLASACSAPPESANGNGAVFVLRARSRPESPAGSKQFAPAETTLRWRAAESAVIVCDMWDRHTCRNATRRVAEMAPRLDAFLKAARRAGALIVHAPSDTMKFYEGTPQRELARTAPVAPAPEKIQPRRLDPGREGSLPVDDSDWCDDDPPCDLTPWTTQRPRAPWPWTRQIAAIEVFPGDAVSESGQEMYNLFKQRGITRVLLTGVHTNMCVLGRSFGIRQMTRVGMDVVLVRDLTDCLYNPKKPPYVSHDRGTELLVEHIEKFWCPSVASADVTGAR